MTTPVARPGVKRVKLNGSNTTLFSLFHLCCRNTELFYHEERQTLLVKDVDDKPSTSQQFPLPPDVAARLALGIDTRFLDEGIHLLLDSGRRKVMNWQLTKNPCMQKPFYAIPKRSGQGIIVQNMVRRLSRQMTGDVGAVMPIVNCILMQCPDLATRMERLSDNINTDFHVVDPICAMNVQRLATNVVGDNRIIENRSHLQSSIRWTLHLYEPGSFGTRYELAPLPKVYRWSIGMSQLILLLAAFFANIFQFQLPAPYNDMSAQIQETDVILTPALRKLLANSPVVTGPDDLVKHVGSSALSL